MNTDLLIFLVVVGLRLGIPLLIFRFPLPAILAALVLDAADQTIFQNNTDLDLSNYQSYDKALDIYYLSIAYLSTFRNWKDPFAARVAQFLWYYRLIGVVAFELTQTRALLLVFPNTFEYFFIAYEVVRLAWDPSRLSRRAVVLMAAFIWVFIKLPQEWWIHVAQLDFTDFMKEDVFGVTVDTSWGTAIGENLWFLGLMAVLVVGVAIGTRAALRAAPPPDWTTSVDVQQHLQSTRLGASPAKTTMWEWDLVEKALLTGLIAVIFSEVVPGTETSPLRILISVSIFVVANALVSQWLGKRGMSWATTASQFGAMVLVNGGLVTIWILFLRRDDEPVNEGALIFFVLMLTLITTLYDRYRPLRSATYPPTSKQPVEAAPA